MQQKSLICICIVFDFVFLKSACFRRKMGEDEVGLESKAPRSARWKLWSVTGSLISFENNWWKLVFNALTWMRESRLLKMSFSQHFSDKNLILRIFRSGVPGVSKLVRTWESQLVRNLIFSNAQEIPSGRDEFWKEIFKNCNKKSFEYFVSIGRLLASRQTREPTSLMIPNWLILTKTKSHQET